MDMLKNLLEGAGESGGGSESEAERLLSSLLSEGLSASEILDRLKEEGFKVTKSTMGAEIEIEPMEEEGEDEGEEEPPTMNAKREKAAKSAMSKHGY